MDLGRMILAALMMSSMVTLPLCLMFFTFFRSRGGSFSALITSAAADGTTVTCKIQYPLSILGLFGNIRGNFFGRSGGGPTPIRRSDWIRIRIAVQPKMLDPDPYQMNKDPKPCFYRYLKKKLLSMSKKSIKMLSFSMLGCSSGSVKI
jgi:hypothetical protein